MRYVGREVAVCTGVREREVSTSLTNSAPFACLHWIPWGPVRAEWKDRGSPSSSRFNTGVDVDDEGVVGDEADANHVGVNGEGGERGARETGDADKRDRAVSPPAPPPSPPTPPTEGAWRVGEREEEGRRVGENKFG